MFRKCLLLNLLLMSIITFSFCSLYAQEKAGKNVITNERIDREISTEEKQKLNIETDETIESCTSFYIELMGKGFYSLNVDFRKNKSNAMSLGVQGVENAFITSFMYYHFRGKTCRFETGGGISSIFTREDIIAGAMIHGVLGYRYQKKNGLLFRTGFTPFIGVPFKRTGRFIIMPWVGISVGYSL